MDTLRSVIAAANSVLPGQQAPQNQTDPRWQAIIAVAEFVPSDPDEVWAFAARWGCSDDPDLREAIATCVLEHLLEHHFDRIFPQLDALARRDGAFARTVQLCWEFGDSETPTHSSMLRSLQRELRDAV